MNNKIAILLIIILSGLTIKAEETKDTVSNHSFDIGADFVSSYVWRSVLFSPVPNIQPYAVYGYKNFSFSTSASYAFDGNFTMINIIASYSPGSFTFTLSDYYARDIVNYNYFNFKNGETQHYIEAEMSYTFQKSIPLTATFASFIYGADYDTENNKNYYSSYLELSYPFTISTIDIKTYFGTTLSKGLYADRGGIVNIGFSAKKHIQISDKYKLPISVAFFLNPTTKDIFMVFGINI